MSLPVLTEHAISELALARDETNLAAFNYLDDLLSKLAEFQSLAVFT